MGKGRGGRRTVLGSVCCLTCGLGLGFFYTYTGLSIFLSLPPMNVRVFCLNLGGEMKIAHIASAYAREKEGHAKQITTAVDGGSVKVVQRLVNTGFLRFTVIIHPLVNREIGRCSVWLSQVFGSEINVQHFALHYCL